MANYINSNELAYSIAPQPGFGAAVTATTRLDLPTEVNQAPLTATTNMIEDNTQRPNRETAAPTRGDESVAGSMSMLLKPCEAIDLLIQSAIAGTFDASTGLAFGGEEEKYFTLYTKLSSRGTYRGYEDGNLVVTKWGITASAKESVKTSFDLMGTTRLRRETAPTQTPVKVVNRAFNYVDVKNIKVNNQPLNFVTLAFETGTPQDGRFVFGEKNAVDMAATGNRATTLNIKGYRKDFATDDLVDDGVVSVSFEITYNDPADASNKLGWRVTLPAAMCKSPTDELNDTGLLIALEFTAHLDTVSNAGLIVERL